MVRKRWRNSICLMLPTHAPAQALDEMQVQGHRPDVGIYNIALEVLTRSGVLSAQLKAAQLFQTASRQGQLRCGRYNQNLFH